MNEFERLVGVVKGAVSARSGVMVAGLPGMGVSHLLGKISTRLGIPMIEDESGLVDCEMVIFNPDFLANPEAAILTEKVYARAGEGTKIVLGVNAPRVLYADWVKSSPIAVRWYKQHWLRTRNKEGVAELLGELGVGKGFVDFNKLLERSGGVARFVKFFVNNREYLNAPAAELSVTEGWRSLAGPFFGEASLCREEWLESMDLYEGGRWASSFLGECATLFGDKIAVMVKDGVELVELGEVTARLLPFEARIIEEIARSRKISKERIYEIRWGGDYESGSDQALAKLMQRLGAKLKRHRLEPILKYGYELRRK